MAIEITTASDQLKSEILGELKDYLVATTWTNPLVAENFLEYSDVEVQLDGTVSGVGFSRSFDGVTYYPCNLISESGAVTATTSTAGIYRLPGNAYLKQTAGSAATKTTYRAGN